MGLDKKYMTGVLWQDYQHTKLINLLEKLKKSKSDGTDAQIFSYAVAFLAMYVNDHFDLEQAYMKEYDYVASEHHISEHTNFIVKLKELRSQHAKYSDEAMNSLINNISDWVKEHIMDNDLKLGRFILQKEKEKYNGE